MLAIMDQYVEIGEKIASARESAGLSQSDLARHLGISPQAVQKWESGLSSPRVSKWKDIADALKTTIASLIEGTRYENDLPTLGERVRVAAFETRKKRAEEGARPRYRHQDKIPLISWIQAAEWGDIVHKLKDEEAEDWISVPFDYGHDSFCLRVTGESMFNPGGEKSYAPGDYIVVDPNREPVNRSMVVVRLTGDKQAIFKQFIIDPDGTMLLQSLNPNWPKQTIEIDDNTEIIGVVIGKWVPE